MRRCLRITVRVSDSSGFALPVVLVVLMVVALLGAAAVLFATHSTDRATRDEASSRAFGAADGAADIATYRINKMVVPEVLGLTDMKSANGLYSGSPTLSLSELLQKTCATKVGVAAGPISVSVVPGGSSWCPTASGVIDEGAAVQAQYEYWIGLGVSAGSGLIDRQVIAVGCVGQISTGDCDAVRRVQVTLRIDANTSLALFKRKSYAECTAVIPSAGNPAAGCPT